VLTVTIVLIPLKSYDFQKAYLTFYYGDRGGIAAFLIVQTAMLRLAVVKLTRDRTEPQFKAASLKNLRIVSDCKTQDSNFLFSGFILQPSLNY
jgi:hypothetical protein